MHGYDPLHIYDEISMFLTLSTKMVLIKHMYILKFKNQTGIFLKLKFFYENTSKDCVSVYDT